MGFSAGEAGINVHDVLPVTTPRGKQMMPPADRMYDPGQGAKKDLTDTGDDFLAIGPALRIMQLNVEGLSAAKREVILHGDQTRCEADFYTVNQRMLTCNLFAVANLLVLFVAASWTSQLTCTSLDLHH